MAEALMRILAIVAVATCMAFRGYVEIRQICHMEKIYTTGARFKYPFSQTLVFEYYDTVHCSKFMTQKVFLDYEVQTKYYGAVGILCFLYSFAVLAYYIVLEPEKEQRLTRQDNSYLKIAIVVSALFVFFWVTSTTAFAVSVGNIKKATDVSRIITEIPGCNSGNSTCGATLHGHYAALDASIVAGFLNVAVWCVNLWFLFKKKKPNTAQQAGKQKYRFSSIFSK